MSPVTLEINVALTEESKALLARLSALAPQAPAVAAAPAVPAIALPQPVEAQEGERYAGIAFDGTGAPAHHLFLLPAKPEKKMKWKAAIAWATSVGGELPTRFESALLYANLADQFETEWHWTSTQYSADLAWTQHFDCGGQTSGGKSYEGLARAVRRLAI